MLYDVVFAYRALFCLQHYFWRSLVRSPVSRHSLHFFYVVFIQSICPHIHIGSISCFLCVLFQTSPTPPFFIVTHHSPFASSSWPLHKTMSTWILSDRDSLRMWHALSFLFLFLCLFKNVAAAAHFDMPRSPSLSSSLLHLHAQVCILAVDCYVLFGFMWTRGLCMCCQWSRCQELWTQRGTEELEIYTNVESTFILSQGCSRFLSFLCCFTST